MAAKAGPVPGIPPAKAGTGFKKPSAAPGHLASEPNKDLPPQKTTGPGVEHRPFSDNEIKSAFDCFDLDKNRFVGAAEIRHILTLIGENATDEEIDEMIRMCDTDGDGQVTFDEFQKLMATPLQAPPPPPAQPKAAPSAMGVVPKGGFSSAPIQKKNLKAGEAFGSDGADLGGLLNQFTGGTKMKPAQIKKIYKKFQDVDVDGSGAIDYPEFLQVLGSEDGTLSRQMFRMFDLDGSGTVELKEFIVVLSRYTSATKTDKLKFAFMMFDEDGSGFIEKNELMRILQSNFVSEGLSQAELDERAAEVFTSLNLPPDSRISYEQFMQLSTISSGLLFPVHAVTHQLGQNLSINKMMAEGSNQPPPE